MVSLISPDSDKSRNLRNLDSIITEYNQRNVGLAANGIDVIRENLKRCINNADANAAAGENPEFIRGQRLGAYETKLQPGVSEWVEGHCSMILDCGGSNAKAFLKFRNAAGELDVIELFKLPSKCDAENLSKISQCADISPQSLKGFEPYFDFFVAEVSKKLKESGILDSCKTLSFGLVWSNACTPQEVDIGIDAITGSFYSKDEDFTKDLAPGTSLLTAFRELFLRNGISIDIGVVSNDTPPLIFTAKDVDFALVMATGFNGARINSGKILNTELGVVVQFPPDCFKKPQLFADRDSYNVQDIVGFGSQMLPRIIGLHLEDFGKMLDVRTDYKFRSIVEELNSKALTSNLDGRAVQALASASEVGNEQARKDFCSIMGIPVAGFSPETFEVCKRITLAALSESVQVAATIAAEFVSHIETPKIVIDSRAARENSMYALQFRRAFMKCLNRSGPSAIELVDVLDHPPRDYRSKFSPPAHGISEALNSLLAKK